MVVKEGNWIIEHEKVEPEKPKKVQLDSSSEEESSGEYEVESETEQPQVNQLPTSAEKSESSSSEEESKSDSEGGVAPTAAVQKSGSAGVEPILKEKHATSSEAAGGKRTKEAMDNKGKKKAKKGHDELVKKKLDLEKSSNEEVKKQLFERVWSVNDEIIFLKGMIDCAKKNKCEPSLLDLNHFHDFIKTKLHFEVSIAQLKDKIRRVKKKFVSNKTREVQKGSARVFSKPHDQEAYALSNEIWGEKIGQNIVAIPKPSVAKKKQIKVKSDELKMEDGKSEDINVEKGKSEQDTEMENADSDTLIGTLEIATGGANVITSSSFNMDGWIRSIGTKLYEGDDIIQGSKEWLQLAVEEIELYDKNLALMLARAKLVVHGLKSKIQ